MPVITNWPPEWCISYFVLISQYSWTLDSVFIVVVLVTANTQGVVCNANARLCVDITITTYYNYYVLCTTIPKEQHSLQTWLPRTRTHSHYRLAHIHLITNHTHLVPITGTFTHSILYLCKHVTDVNTVTVRWPFWT